MIDEDFYFEESNPKKVFLAILLILFVSGLCFGAYYYINKRDNLKLKDVTVELGSTISENIEDYVKSGRYDGFTLDITNVYVNEEGIADSVGEYSYKLTKNNIIKKGKLFVKDTTPPEVTLHELKVGLNEEFDISDFVTSCEDLSEVCNVTYASDKYYDLIKEEGTHNVTLIIKDKYENEVTKKTTLIVSSDFSLNELKAQDKEVANIYPIDNDWDNIYTVKFEKGLSEEDETFEAEILDLANINFQNIYNKDIKNKTMLTIYNKYHYVLGFSIKLEFVDGEIIYVPEKDLIKENEE